MYLCEYGSWILAWCPNSPVYPVDLLTNIHSICLSMLHFASLGLLPRQLFFPIGFLWRGESWCHPVPSSRKGRETRGRTDGPPFWGSFRWPLGIRRSKGPNPKRVKITLGVCSTRLFPDEVLEFDMGNLGGGEQKGGEAKLGRGKPRGGPPV